MQKHGFSTGVYNLHNVPYEVAMILVNLFVWLGTSSNYNMQCIEMYTFYFFWFNFSSPLIEGTFSSTKTDAKKTLSDILVRVDRDKKN
jgi:hypothetical protein